MINVYTIEDIESIKNNLMESDTAFCGPIALKYIEFLEERAGRQDDVWKGAKDSADVYTPWKEQWLTYQLYN